MDKTKMQVSDSSKIRYFGYFLIVAICVLFFHTIITTHVVFIEVSDLGLLKLLPFSFWLGLVLLALLWYVGKNDRNVAIFALILTCCYLYIIPSIVKIPVSISQSYYPYGEIRLININEHLLFRDDAIFKSYLFWPGFLYIGSALTLVTGIPDSLILKFFPPLVVAFYGLLTFLILRKRLGTFYSLIAAGWFLAAFFLRQQYFGPPSIGYIYFLTIFLIISWFFFENRAKNREMFILLLLLFVVTTFTHVLTAFLVIGMVFAIYLSNRISRVRYQEVSAMILFLAIIFLSYNMLVTPAFFDWAVLIFSNVFAGERELGLYNEPNRIVGSTANQLNYYSSLALVAINFAIAVFAIIYELKKGSKSTNPLNRRYFIFIMIFLVELAIFGLAAEYGPHESYQRAFMFALVPLAFLCVNFVSKKRRLVLVFLVILIFLNIPAQYGSDSYTLATDSELVGAEFFASHTPDKIEVIHKQSMYIRYYDPEKNVKFLIITGLPPTSIPNATLVSETVNEADYIVMSDLQNNYYTYFLGTNPLQGYDYSELNRLYDSGSFVVYNHVDETS